MPETHTSTAAHAPSNRLRHVLKHIHACAVREFRGVLEGLEGEVGELSAEVQTLERLTVDSLSFQVRAAQRRVLPLLSLFITSFFTNQGAGSQLQRRAAAALRGVVDAPPPRTAMCRTPCASLC